MLCSHTGAVIVVDVVAVGVVGAVGARSDELRFVYAVGRLSSPDKPMECAAKTSSLPSLSRATMRSWTGLVNDLVAKSSIDFSICLHSRWI